MKIVLLIALMMTSILSMAHSGHGEAGIIAHDAEHMIWTFSGLALLVSVVGFWILKRR